MSIGRHWKWFLIAPGGLAAFALFVVFGGWIVSLLWNWLLPPLFGWPTITLWQALGLLALCRILFGGFRLGGSGPSKHMTKQDRERMRARMCRSSKEGETS